MAVAQGEITLNEISLFEVDSDPAVVPGLAASIGSLAILGDQISAAAWIKAGVSDTAWSRLGTFPTTLQGEPTGYATRATSALEFDVPSRTFTILPVGPSFDFYIAGQQFTKNAAQNIAIPDVTGPYFFYFDSSGTLAYLTTFNPTTILQQGAYTGFVYWSSTDGAATVFADERHGLIMDGATHAYLHTTRGTMISNGGFVLGDYTTAGTGAADSDATVSVTGGSVIDEDLILPVVDSPTPSDPYEQILSPAAKIPVYYFTGSPGEARIFAATDYPIHFGTTRAQWNQFSAGTWSVVDGSTDSTFIAMWLFATNDSRHPVIALMGQRQDTGLTDAQANNQFQDLIFDGLPFQEFKLLYRVIFETNSTYANAVKSAIRHALDFRKGIDYTLSSTYQPNDHGGLSGLPDDDHTQYFLLGGRAGGQIAHGGLNAADNLRIRSTAHTTKGSVFVDDGSSVGIGLYFASNPAISLLDIDGQITIRGGTPGAGKFLQSDATGTGSWVNLNSTQAHYVLYADQFETPNSANWTVNALASIVADSANTGIVVARFDDTTEEGVGFTLFVPAGATNMTIYFVSRAQTAPGSTQGVVPRLWSRQFPDNAAVTAWSAATALTAISIPTNANFQYDSQTISLATLGITAGRDVQFELTRQGTNGSDTLAGDWDLRRIIVEFT